jgi:hypothetical protein
MTLREKIADWVSGGALSKSKQAECEWQSRFAYNEKVLLHKIGSLLDAHAHLLMIVELETPNMAHVGKKAVAIAKRGLGE